MRRNSACCTVQSQFSYGNAHPMGSEIPETKDPGPIGNDDYVHVVMWPVVYHGVEHSTIISREVHASGAAEPMTELQAHLPDGRCIYERC